ncbi:DUF3419 family protein [Pseudohoeflea suaedae]|uniref:DUF3419 family protein n=1 Tax=Pseudohoeflea suaedae TaxID=877384 RepID=A0A4R5PJI9_9HYPH|nr:DUF3419 family protein [Pseudohoeflea suaedae]TDH35833.1 DUF3419 family protein [Pseudohoeflea suaedae]
MSITDTASGSSIGHRIDTAVVRSSRLSREGMLEHLFSAAFRGLVYPQIWEDPVVDMEALALKPTDDVIAIASGSCNVMSYLTADPASITAVDLSPAHVALGRLKIAAARHLPDQKSFENFFRHGNLKSNTRLYDRYLRDRLDSQTRAYWDGRDALGRRRITRFTRGFHQAGLLGRFIGAAHLVAKLYGVDPRELLNATSIEEQRAFFETRIAPIFDSRSFRHLTSLKASLFGLGIPPAQYEALAGDEAGNMTRALKIRTERLACGFDLRENYFAWQAFGRGYGPGAAASLPPYLRRDCFETVRRNAPRLTIENESLTELLRNKPDGSLDAYVLLDAQDWMTGLQLSELWAQITRTARPGARVIYRTAAAPSPLPGKVPDAILDRWAYRAEENARLTRQDRSAIYGGFHLHVLGEL